MKQPMYALRITLCGPGDVAKEIAIALEVVAEWNQRHGEARGVWLKARHWRTDAHPELGERAQAVVNGQIIDDAEIIVAIFWSRFGSPTGAADSGTQEEIIRGVKLAKKVMVYFSGLEPLPAEARPEQVAQVENFRQELWSQGLCGSFQSRQKFRDEFTRHLAEKVNQLRPAVRTEAGHTVIGNRNTIIEGDVTVVTERPVVKQVIARREGSLTNAEQNQVQGWISELVEGTARMPRARAFQMWWQRFKQRLKVTKYEELESVRLPEAEAWFREQRAIQRRGLKTKAPDLWRNARIGAIKAAMKSMGRINHDYYPELSARLKIKPAFGSLTKLTKVDLERVYAMVLRDAR